LDLLILVSLNQDGLQAIPGIKDLRLKAESSKVDN
jgi:hypothetical protein